MDRVYSAAFRDYTLFGMACTYTVWRVRLYWAVIAILLLRLLDFSSVGEILIMQRLVFLFLIGNVSDVG